jgi:hypothetical protein
MRVVRARHDSVGERAEPPEQAFGVARRAKEAEVVTEHHDRVEPANGVVEVFEGEQPHVANSACACHLDRARRDVDPDDASPTPLQFQSRAPRAHTGVKHPAAHEAECTTLHRRPVGDGCEVDHLHCVEEPVVPLDDLQAGPPEEHLPKGVRHARNLYPEANDLDARMSSR